ncbi:MAG: hypothetical protein HRT68_08255 [Flavobacteriaceae bacterium]|nr:hypothetical protein [Flavobacteriaceae bacterium]
MLLVIKILLISMVIYFGIGLLFSIYFFLKGAAKIDPLIKDSSWKVRLLLMPGAMITWVFLFAKLMKR